MPNGDGECLLATDTPLGCLIDTPQDNNGNQCPAAGNPINLGSGNKFQKFTVELNSEINFEMFYNSYRTFDTGPDWHVYGQSIIGKGWSADTEARISAAYNYSPNCSNDCPLWFVNVWRPDGRVVWFTKQRYNNNDSLVGEWNRYSSRNTEKIRLIREANQWVLYREDGLKEVYGLVQNPYHYQGLHHNEGKMGAIKQVYKTDGTYLNYSSAGNLIFYRPFLPKNVSYLVSDAVGDFKFEYVSVTTEIRKLGKIIDVNDPSREWVFSYDANYEILKTITYPDSTVTKFHYDENHVQSDALLTGITGRRGIRYSTYAYEAHGLAYSSELAGGVNKVSINYSHSSTDEFTRTVTDSLNRLTTYKVEKRNNELFKVKEVIGPGCGSCTNGNSNYDYDSENNTTVKTIDGITTTYSIKTSAEKLYGQYSSKTIAPGTPEEKTIHYTWDVNFHKKPKTITEPSVHTGSNKVTTYTYHSNGQPTSIKVDGFKPDGTAISKTTTYKYDGPYGQISEINGSRPGDIDKTVFEYYPANDTVVNNRNRLQRVTGPENIIERDNIQWTAYGDVLSEQRPNGITISNTYHSDTKWLKFSSITDGSKTIVTKYSYLSTGQVRLIKNNWGTAIETTLTMEYDDALRLRKITDHLGNYKEFVLDTEGNLKEEKIFDANDTLKKIMSQTFDIYNQVDTSTSSGVTMDYNYADTGVLADVINGRGVVTDYSYDELNRLSLISQDYQGSDPATANTNTVFDYDVQGNVDSVIDARGHETKYHYDDFGNLVKLESPDTGVTLYDYDEAGNMTSKTDANGITVTMRYDGLGRLTGNDYTDNSQDTTFTYDQGTNGVGRMSSFLDETGSTTFEYTKFGNLDTKTQVVTGFNDLTYQGFNDLVIDYDYDNYNRVGTMTYPSGLQLSYEYDGLSRINKIVTFIDSKKVEVAKNVDYLPFGSIESIDFGNGQNFDTTFDNGYRLENFSYGINTSTYTYDNNHNITSINTKTYDYDKLDRLNLEGYYSYEYDKLGNRTLFSTCSPDADFCAFTDNYYNYNSNNNRLESSGIEFPTQRYYDNNGNTLETKNFQTGYPVTLDSWVYNQNNRLSQFTRSGTVRGKYYYNAIGQRVHKTQYKASGGLAGEFLFVYDQQGQLIHVSKYKNGEHKWDRETIWLNDRPIARVETRYTSGTVTSQDIYYIQTDHLNTPRWITNASGVRIWEWESDAFGVGLPNLDVDGDGTNFTFNMRFPGQYFDQESKTHYNYFRDYEPKTGRYIQSDPIGLLGSINTYIFVDNN